MPAQAPIVETFVEAARPHVWYFAAAADCVSAPQASSYTLDLRLADGSQLGYDELGMPAIYGCFLAINLALLAAHGDASAQATVASNAAAARAGIGAGAPWGGAGGRGRGGGSGTRYAPY